MNPGLHYRFSNKIQFCQLYAWTTSLKGIQLLRWDVYRNFQKMRAIDCKSYWTEISQSFAFVAALIDPYQFEHQAGNSYYNIWNNKQNSSQASSISISPPWAKL